MTRKTPLLFSEWNDGRKERGGSFPRFRRPTGVGTGLEKRSPPRTGPARVSCTRTFVERGFPRLLELKGAEQLFRFPGTSGRYQRGCWWEGPPIVTQLNGFKNNTPTPLSPPQPILVGSRLRPPPRLGPNTARLTLLWDQLLTCPSHSLFSFSGSLSHPRVSPTCLPSLHLVPSPVTPSLLL